MDGVQELINWLLVLIPIAAAPRAIMCLISINADAEQAGTYSRRLKNLLYFVVIAETITALLAVIKRYF